MNRNIDGLASNKDLIAQKNEDLNDELEHLKSLNTNLRDGL